MRFSRKLDYRIAVDDDILSYTIPKLILQPFVENAIVHGLERPDYGGLVTVGGTRAGVRLLFSFVDNGVGMDEAMIEELLLGAGGRSSYSAIRNVKERMALRYGEKGGLEITRAEGGGTEVRIVIPVEGRD
jgi:two-component system sensor histidine kinase YesM